MHRRNDDVAPITFAQPLRCGMDDCETQTTSGLVEPDQLAGLWRLLPICPDCLRGLSAGGRLRLRERDAHVARRH